MSLWRQVRRKLIIALASVVAFLLGATVLLWSVQGRFIFPAPPTAEIPGAHPGASELWRLPSESGEVVALYFAGPPDAPVAVLFHGNGEELANYEDWGWQLHARGLGALAVEYPGYGLARASGPPSEPGCYAAAEVALAHLREKLGVPPSRTVLVGHSLGSAVAAEMALRGRGARLVLLSPITSIADEANLLVPWLPTRLLVRHRFATLEKAPRLALPTLIVHGARDEVAPVWMGEKLARALPDARLVIHPTAGHDLIWPNLAKLAACVESFARGGECTL